LLTPNGADELAVTMALACEKVLGTPRARLGVPALCA
jgi:hypothetical protein